MYYGIYDKYTIKNLKPLGKYPIVIRILDEKEEPLKNFDNVLTLYISDITREIDDPNIFNEKHIKEINNFILNNKFDEVIVHCTLGVSRSPAIMALIALIIDNKKMYNEIITNEHFVPNKLILKKSLNYPLIKKEISDEMILRNNFSNYEDITIYDPKTKTLSFKL